MDMSRQDRFTVLSEDELYTVNGGKGNKEKAEKAVSVTRVVVGAAVGIAITPDTDKDRRASDVRESMMSLFTGGQCGGHTLISPMQSPSDNGSSVTIGVLSAGLAIK